MHYKKYFYISIFCFITGALWISLQNNWIILRFKTQNIFSENLSNTPCQASHKKKCSLWYWKNDSWSCEHNEILWGPDTANNIFNLVQNWLTLLDDEKITSNKITLQSALITSNNQTAYLSFDQNLFNKDDNTYQKLMLVEGLLKTLRTSYIATPHIQILIQHQIAKDPHLDFSNPWPLNGFLKT